jgi:hypothetical protein
MRVERMLGSRAAMRGWSQATMVAMRGWSQATMAAMRRWSQGTIAANLQRERR